MRKFLNPMQLRVRCAMEGIEHCATLPEVCQATTGLINLMRRFPEFSHARISQVYVMYRRFYGYD